MISPIDALLIIPGIAIPILALVSNYRVGAALNVVAAGASFAAGIALLFAPRSRSDLIIVDDFNIYLITLTTFVGLTTSIFSASYIA
ncbi:MAG: hydrogenase 4 subunit F, partial [Xanthobacteraceae bacterium]